MKNKLTLILCLLLVPAIAYPWAGQSIVDVLVQLIDSDVQVDSLGVGCAASGTSGEVKASALTDCDGDWSIDSSGKGAFNGGVTVGNLNTAASEDPGSGYGGIYWLNSGNAFYIQRPGGTGADVYASQFLGALRGDLRGTFRDYAGDGPGLATYGITYPEVTAPSAPSSGGTIYCDSADGNLKVIFSDGDIVTIATNP